MNDNMIAISTITPSTTNPRKHFDKVGMEELTDSVKRHGILQPVLVRRRDSKGGEPILMADGFAFELVAGERRFRAAKAAGLAEIPANVMELSDAEVLEIQVVENLQRRDLSPLEEADGYHALMQCAHGDGRPYTAEEIAHKVGKSKSYVYARLKLFELCPAGRNLLMDGEISTSVAEVIARIPSGLQDKAIASITRPYAPRTLAAVREHVQEEFMLKLGGAPFNVKSKAYFMPNALQPLPTCSACPKRTGNQVDLFADVKEKDLCTDPTCYGVKTAAAAAEFIEAQRAAGVTVIEGAEAKKLLPSPWASARGFVKPTEVCYEDPQHRTWEKLLGKACPEAVLVAHPSEAGKFVELIPEAAAVEAAQKKGFKFFQEAAEEKAAREAEDAKRTAELDREREVERQLRAAVREAIGKKGVNDALILELSREMVGDGDWPDWDFGDAGEEPDMDSLLRRLSGASSRELHQLYFDLLQASNRLSDMGSLEAIARGYGLDVKAISKKAKADAKKASKAPPQTSSGVTPIITPLIR